MKYRCWTLLLCLLLAACSFRAEEKMETTSLHEQTTGGVSLDLLQAYHWQLSASADPALLRPQAPITLDFAAGRLRVSNSCNILSASYRLSGNELELGQMLATRRACTGELEHLDDKVSAVLVGRHALEFSVHKQLILQRDEQTLVFDGVPTARTRFESEPERVFLEVAAQRQLCSHPLMGDHQCLLVRERHYDAQGLKVGGPGAFQFFYDEIEGFQFEPGVRTVLRVDRYERAAPPADASRFAYVLDLIVEQELAPPSCSAAEFDAIEARLDTSDGHGHGPDIGSDEWQHTVMRRLGLNPDQLPEAGSRDWCAAIQRVLDGRPQQ